MNTPPLTIERRVEYLERRLQFQEDLLKATDRLPQGRGRRWAYWGVTWKKDSPEEGEEYPEADGDNTFPFRFVDLEFEPTIGAQELTKHYRTGLDSAPYVGCTSNGQWLLPDELVMITPIPPAPNTEDKGRWLITPQKTYYYGKLLGTLGRLSSTQVKVYKQSIAGTFDETDYTQTVWDARFLAEGVTLEAGTWVRFEWETIAWVVTNAGCEPEPEEEE